MSEARQNSYPEIIHALDHEHTRRNFERHVQVIGKWSRACGDGIFVRDLEHVNTILELLQHRLEAHMELFEAVTIDVLRTCAKPLLEFKANERLRQAPMEHIKQFLILILGFLSAPSVMIQIECTKTVRVILNGGIDHSVLKSDIEPWRSADGASVQITDTEYIHSLIRVGGGIHTIVSRFCSYVSLLGEAQSKYAGTKSPVRSALQDDAEQDLEQSTTEAGSESDDDIPGIVPENNDLSDLKKRLYNFRKLAEGLLYICLDLSFGPKNASFMCTEGVSDAAIMLIEVTSNPRDIWTSRCIELLWNCLEAYYDEKEALMVGEGAIDPIADENTCSHDTFVLTFDIALGVLRNLFLTLLFEGYRNADKELRNEVIIVLTLIAKDTRSVPYFINSGMLTDLVTYSCAAEVGPDGWFYASKPMAKMRNFSSVFDVDLQLKREMWLLLSDLLRTDDPDVILCVASSPFLRVLCKYLEFDTADDDMMQFRETHNGYDPQTPDNAGNAPAVFTANFGVSAPSVSTTSLPHASENADYNLMSASPLEANRSVDMTNDLLQTGYLPITSTCGRHSRDDISDSFLSTVPLALMRELQVLAVNVLSDCSHRVMAEFLRIRGPLIALSAVDKYTDSLLVEHKSFVSGCLLLLNKCVTHSSVGKSQLEGICAIKCLLRLFEKSDDDITKGHALRLFSIMSIGSPAAQTQIRDYDGIPVLVRALAQFPATNKPLVGQTSAITCPGVLKSHGTPDAATEEVSSFMIALLDAIWMSIVGNSRNESIFAECGGTDALLEALECSSFLLRGMILRVVADLLMNRRLLAFVESWRSSRSMRSVNQLLAHAWMDEEARLGVSRDSGVLCNIWSPLNAHGWPLDPCLQDNRGLPTSRVDAAESVLAASVRTDNTSSVWFPAILHLGHEVGDSPPKTSIVEKLAHAVTMSRKDTAGSRVALRVRMEASSKDMRGVIAGILSTLGLLDGEIIDEGCGDNIPPSKQAPVDDSISLSSSTVGDGQHVGVLNPSDIQVLCVAKRYDTLREGEWWKYIIDDLRRVGVNPIEEDLRLIELKLDAAFEATQAAQFEQMELDALDKRIKVKSEDAFMRQILRQKHQQIKSEWLKRNAHREKANKNKQHSIA